MRSRFLNIDYFSTISSPPIGFLYLSIPCISPPRPYNFQEHFRCLSTITDASLLIDKLPIDSSLRKFFSEVIPQNTEVTFGNYCDHDHRFNFSEKDNKEAVSVGSDFIYFEEPESCTLLGNVSFPEEREAQILSQVREFESSQELLQPLLKKQCLDKLKESIYSAENINLPYEMDQYICGLEDEGAIHNQKWHEMLPLLEVDGTSLRAFTNPSVEQVLLLLEKTESQYVQEVNPLIDELEALNSIRCDVMGFLSDHCLPRQGLESQLSAPDDFTVMDIISMVETSPRIEENTGSFSPKNPFIFEEFKFHLVDLCQLYEVIFEKQPRFEPETCDWIFSEETKSKKFDELVVSSELALVDDTFRSLPVPILCDDNKRSSMHNIAEETLSGQKMQSLTATDEIYLDWQLWEEDKCNSENYFKQRILREVQLADIDFDCESSDDGRLISGFIFSDVILNVQKMEECKESFDMLCEGTSKAPLKGVPSNNSTGHKYPESDNRGQNAKENSGRASVLFQSMSQFNDLDFFLNPGKTTAGLKCEPAVMPPKRDTGVPKEGDYNSISVLVDDVGDCKFERQPNFSPTERSYSNISSNSGDKAQTCKMPVLVRDVTHAMKSEQSHGVEKSFPVTILIVNTQNSDTEMIVSRRSSYQRILALEKEGAQVVERDLDLPVDVIINPAICLVWYNCRNIGKKAIASYEASSCLPLCIDNIATKILTLLSFCFSGCILVFEGEANFLSAVIECSDGLYAAAASLGIDCQIFCSSSCDLTNDIILNSILSANKSHSICPNMAESETLAESFLTKFPSVNPLMAHAIISSCGTLKEFFERSYEQRVHALQQYQVPVESVALFSTLSRYGEREDSKSIMTDCSSSVSSGPDSDKSHVNVHSLKKRQRYIYSPEKIDIHVNGTWPSKLVNLLPDDMQGPSEFSKQYYCRIPADNEMLDGLEWPSSSLKDPFGGKLGDDDVWKMDSSDIFKSYDRQNSNSSLAMEGTKKPIFSLDDKLFRWNPEPEITMKNRHDFIDEVVNLSPMSGNNASTAVKNANLQPWLPEIEQDSIRKSKTAKRLSFGGKSHCSFSTADDINSDLRTPVKDYKQSLQENESLPDTNVNYNKAPPNHQQMLLEEELRQRSARISKESPFKDEISYYGGTPLSKAVNSVCPRPGSPWTVEFLNRIREKSRLRQQSLPCDTSTPICGLSGNIRKANKRRSPSIIDFFRYQGGSTPARALEKKKLKQSMQLPHSSKNAKNSASFAPTWTPIDKRSSQTLSFAMSGDGNQTRLVWSDGSAHYPSKRLRNH